MATLTRTALSSRPKPASSLQARGPALLTVAILIWVLLGAAAVPDQAQAGAAPDAHAAGPAALLDATLGFDQDQYAVVVNDTITLDLAVEDVANLAAWEVKLSFDPARLEIAQVTPGPFLAITGRTVESLQLAPGSRQLSLGGYTYGDLPAVSGAGLLARLTVRGLAAGQAPITLSGPILAGMDGSGVRPLPVAASGAVVNVTQPLAVALASFQATAQRDGILVAWETVSELDNQGFNLYRAADPAAPQELLAFIPSQAPGSSQGFIYEWLDSDVTAGETVYYWLESIDASGAPAIFGPVSATLQAPSAVALAGIQAAAEAGEGGGWPWVLARVVALHVVVLALTPPIAAGGHSPRG